MRAVHVGVGHDDDPAVAQLARGRSGRRRRSPAPRSGPSAPGSAAACRPRRWRRSGSCRAAAAPPGCRGCAPAWPSRRRCRPRPGRSRSRAAFSRVQSVSLPGSRSRRVADLRGVSFASRRRSRSSARSMTKASRLSAGAGSPASQWSNRSRSAVSTSRVASGAGQLLLGLALELRLAQEQRQLGRHRPEQVLGGHLRRRGGCRAARPRRAGPSAVPRGTRPRGCRPAASARCCSRSGGTPRPPRARRRPIRPGRCAIAPGRSASPDQSCGSTRGASPMSASRLSRRPPGKCSTASAGVSSLPPRSRPGRRTSGFRRRGTDRPSSGTADRAAPG